MLKIKKIVDKQIIEVLAQYTCTKMNKPRIYADSPNCWNDCTHPFKPRYYQSVHT